MVGTSGGTEVKMPNGDSQAGVSPPAAHASPPPPPAPGASRAEWRAWRRSQRDYVRAQSYGGTWSGPLYWRGGGWFVGALLLVIGVYYLLYNLGQLAWLKADVLWPVLLIVFGVWLLLRRRNRWF